MIEEEEPETHITYIPHERTTPSTASSPMATIVVGLRPSACVSLVRVVLVGRSLPSATRVIAASKLSTTSRHDCTQSHYHSTTSTGASVTARSPVMQRRLYSLKAARRHLSKEFEARSESKAAAAPALHDNQVRMAPPMSTNVVADQYVPLKSYVNPVAWWGAFRSFMSTRVSLFRMRSTNPTFKPYVDDAPSRSHRCCHHYHTL